MVIYIILYRSSIMMFFHADFKAWWFQSIDSDWCGWPPVMISSWLSWCLWFSHSFRVLHRLEKGWEPKALRFIFLWLMCNQDWTTAPGSSCFPFVSVLSLPTCYDIPTNSYSSRPSPPHGSHSKLLVDDLHQHHSARPQGGRYERGTSKAATTHPMPLPVSKACI